MPITEYGKIIICCMGSSVIYLYFFLIHVILIYLFVMWLQLELVHCNHYLLHKASFPSYIPKQPIFRNDFVHLHSLNLFSQL